MPIASTLSAMSGMNTREIAPSIARSEASTVNMRLALPMILTCAFPDELHIVPDAAKPLLFVVDRESREDVA